MENASKALIIAGAILISILIIGLGVFIYNQAKGAIGNTGIDAQAAESNNQQFTAYFGTNKSASEVKNLISLVRSYNINKSTSSGGYKIGFWFTGKIPSTSGTGGTEDCNKLVDMSNLTKYIDMGRSYEVTTPNEDNTEQGEDSIDPTDTSASSSNSEAYYSNGFLRIIKIVKK